MARSAFATACGLVSLLALTGTALAEPPCGVVITDVIETAPGALTPVGEGCYERGPGVPFYYDAPVEPGPRIEVEAFDSAGASLTRFEAITIQALGAQSIDELVKPFPPGQGEADSRSE